MDILKLARTGMTIHKLTQDDFYQIFSKLELNAASEAMRKAYMAKDYKLAVMSAITHLESAEAALSEKVIKVKGNHHNILGIQGFSILSTDTGLRHHEIRYNFFSLFYIYTLMAILYKLIGERKLSCDALKKIAKYSEIWKKFSLEIDPTAPGPYLNPANWRYINRKLPIEPEQMQEFIDIVWKEWNLSEEENEYIAEGL